MRLPWIPSAALLVVSSSGAQPSQLPPAPAEPPVMAATTVGTYQGVVPVVHDEPAMPTPRGAPPRLTWPGFQVRDRRAARVFVQFTSVPPYALRREGARVIVEFSGATIHQRNNSRRVDTRHFGTVVRGFQVRAAKKGLVRLVIDTDTAAMDPPRVTTEESGSFQYLYVDFPPPPAGPAPTQVQMDDGERPR